MRQEKQEHYNKQRSKIILQNISTSFSEIMTEILISSK